MIDRNGNVVVPLTAGAKGKARNESDPLEESGKAIIGLLKEAADTARATCEQALSKSQKLADQLRAAETRMKEMESEVRLHQERADRAEKWLAHVRDEIEERFFGSSTAAQR
jgi:folate-binding Fe-S cluster repair protein YgfZ